MSGQIICWSNHAIASKLWALLWRAVICGLQEYQNTHNAAYRASLYVRNKYSNWANYMMQMLKRISLQIMQYDKSVLRPLHSIVEGTVQKQAFYSSIICPIIIICVKRKESFTVSSLHFTWKLQWILYYRCVYAIWRNLGISSEPWLYIFDVVIHFRTLLLLLLRIIRNI